MCQTFKHLMIPPLKSNLNILKLVEDIFYFMYIFSISWFAFYLASIFPLGFMYSVKLLMKSIHTKF